MGLRSVQKSAVERGPSDAPAALPQRTVFHLDLLLMSNQALLSAWQRRWHRSLLRFLASRARHVDIADLAQETYLRLLRAPDLREVRNPEAYLIRVASHVAAEWTFSARTLEKLTASMNAALVEENTPELEVQATLSQQRVEQLFKELPAAVKAALVLRLREGQSYKQIAKTLNLSERQIKRYLERGLLKLRAAMNGEESL